MSVFLALLIFFTSINFEIAEAAEIPEPYQYWAVSISSYAETLGGGLSFKLGKGSNLSTPNDMYVFDGYPFNKDIPVIVNSNATPGAEYQNFDDATLLTYEDYMMKTDQVPQNKDDSFRTMKYLATTNEEGRSIPISNFSYLGGSGYSMDLNFPDKQTMIDYIPFEEKDGTTDGTRRIYRFYVTYVLEIHHDKFDPVTGEWDIESKVDALLNMSKETPAVWNYKDFDNGFSTEYEVYMDASASSSARPGEEYTYDMGVNVGGDVDYRNEKTVSGSKYVLSGDIFPDEISGTVKRNGSFRVDGNVIVTDDKGVSDSAYSYTDVDYEIINEQPTAIYKAIDSATSSDKYLYSKRSIIIKDMSLDPEFNLMDSSFNLYDGEKQIATWTFKKDKVDGTWVVISSYKLDEYIEDMASNPSNLENTLTFKKSGSYRLEQTIGDIRGHKIVSQKFDTRNSYLNIRPESAPPKADFEYRLNGKPTDYTYPNVEVALLDKSVDPNDDIIKWEWTKHNGAKHDGQNGNTAVFPAEGTYNTSLKVTDFLGLTDNITKPIEVLPPIPKAEIVTNEAESLMKKNRRIIISSEDSFAPPSDPIQWDKTKWKIDPLDGQSSSSIKISNSLSDNKKKAVVFKETGKYKVTIDLENNYTQSNPNHPRISLKTTSIVIEIKDDIKPTPQFEITGNSPNFKDNPVSTTAKVINTSESPDIDYLDIFPNIGLDDPNNFYGRGQDTFELEIRKDKDENGIFSDSEVYGNYTTRSIDIPVTFKENEGSDYQATLKIKETFGQPTITEFVNENDRVSNTLIKKFSINWVPFIEFKLPEWAYPDDEIIIKTTLKDEKIDTTKVVWSVDKKNTDGSYTNLLIDSSTINTLLKEGGKIRFLESGFYKLTAEITDEKGQKSSHTEEIRIYPFPTAVISDNPAYRFDNTGSPAEFNAKQNRTYELSGNTSHINDSYGSGIHNIDHSKDYFEIIPTSGQPVDTIKVTDGIGGILNLTSEDGTIFKATNKQLDRTMLFKLPGTYTVRYQVTNIHGKKSDFAEKTVTVHEDEKPLAEFDIQEKVLRDPTDGNKAAITMFNIKLSSIDRDNISLERVRYRFDSNNDGNFEEESWINTNIDKINPFNWNVKVKESHVGKYEFELYAEESYGQATINRYITEADKRSNIMTKVCEIDNQAPTADFSMAKIEKVDVSIGVENLPFDKIGQYKIQAENIIKNKLSKNNIISNVNIVPLQPKIKVLEINHGEETLKTLMERYGASFTTVDCITLDQFEMNYNNIWSRLDEYDTVVFGFADKYYDFSSTGRYKNKNPYTMNETMYDVIENYIKSGKGVIFSHDTLGMNLPNKTYKFDYSMNFPISGKYYDTFTPTDFNTNKTWYNFDIEFEAKPLKNLSSLYKDDRGMYVWRTSGSDKAQMVIHVNARLGIEMGKDGIRIARYHQFVSGKGDSYSQIISHRDFPININSKTKIRVSQRYISGRMLYKIYVNDTLMYTGTDYSHAGMLPPRVSVPYGLNGEGYTSGGFISVGDRFQNQNDGLYSFNIQASEYGEFGMDRFIPYIFDMDNEPYNRTMTAFSNPTKQYSSSISMYPYTVPSNLLVSNTHAQYVKPYNDTLVHYGVTGALSSYYLASKNNVYFINAGNSDPKSSPEDEQKLIVNTVFKAASHKTKSIDISDIQVSYFDNSKKFIGLVNSNSLENLIDPTESLILSSKFIRSNINFSVLGTASNKSQFDSFNKKNNGNGIFIDNTDIDAALNEYADYIISEVKSKTLPTTAYVLLNEEMDYKINYEDYENDPQMNFHSWKYDHDASYFENSLGRISKNNQWLSNSINKFDKVGEYKVEYRTKDNPVGADDRFDNYRKYSTMPSGPMTIYVHRKPVAKMKPIITKTSTTISANITSLGYDLDHISLINKGIRAWEWSYKEVGSSNWISAGNSKTFTFSGDINKDYFVKHRVQDTDGENGIGVWSDENIILVTAKAMPPVADFEVDPTVYPIRTSMAITDFSYDPNGDILREYRWTLKKDGITKLTRTLANPSGVTQSQVDTVRNAVKSTIDSMGHLAYGEWVLDLQINDSSGIWGDPLATSDIVSKTIEVIPYNSPPVASIDTTNVFVDGRNSMDADNLDNTLNEFMNWNLSVSDPDTDNKGFLYRWELEHHGTEGILKSTSDMSSSDTISTKIYTDSVPFSNETFDSKNLAPGPYRVNLEVTDIPAYGEAKSTSVDTNFYIVPKVTGVPYVILEEGKEEIICGDAVTLRIITDEITTGITAEAEGKTINLSFVKKQGSQYIWETPFVIPELEASGNMDITFTLKTDFGSKDVFGTEGKATRIKTLKETIYVTALKLDDFRVTDLVKHSQYKDLYPLRRPDFTLDYIAGYYCIFQINAKGNPERVFADVSHNTSEVGTVELKKVGDSGTYGVWEGKYFAPFDTPRNTVISFDLEARKGSTKYNYNEKESWDGETLVVVDTLLRDAKIQRTN